MKSIICVLILITSFQLNANTSPVKTVKEFLQFLDGQPQKAFELTNNPAWGSKEKFCSEKAFGAIDQVNILKLKKLPDENNLACVSALVEIFDFKNGHGRFEEKLFLEKQKGNWKIVKLKVLKAEKINLPSKELLLKHFDEQVEGSTLYYSEMRYYPGKFTDTEYEECLIKRTESTQYNYNTNYAIYQYKDNVWHMVKNGNRNDLKIGDIDNYSGKELVDDYCEAVPRNMSFFKHFSVRSFMNSSEKLYFEEETSYPGDGWFGFTDIEVDDVLYDSTTYKFIDVDKDKVKELVADYNIYYSNYEWQEDEDWQDSNPNHVKPRMKNNFARKVKYKIVYKLNTRNLMYEHLSDKYSLKLNKIYDGKDYPDEDTRLDVEQGGWNDMFQKLKISLDLPGGGGKKESLQVIVDVFEDGYKKNVYKQTWKKDFRAKHTHVCTVPYTFGCSNILVTVKKKDKIVLMRALEMVCAGM